MSCILGVNRGGWYFEVSIDDMPADSATRIGWVQQLGKKYVNITRSSDILSMF